MGRSKYFWSLFVILNLAAAAESAQTSNSVEISETVLSRRKRNYGGKEPIDFPKAINAVFGTPGMNFCRKFFKQELKEKKPIFD